MNSKKKTRKQRVLVPLNKKNNYEYLKMRKKLKNLKYDIIFVKDLKKRGYEDMVIGELEKLLKSRLKKTKKEMMEKYPRQMKNEEIPELKVLNMDIDTLKHYLFPNDPMVPLSSVPVQELHILKELDGTTKDVTLLKNLKHVRLVTDKLEEFILDECQHTRFQSNTDNYIHRGKYVNIESLLFPHPDKDYLIRRNGRKLFATSLKGKYIMVFCCFFPVCWESDVWQAVLASYEMYSKLNGDFEMVIAAKMRRGWTYDESAFNQFFDAFPSPCLAVPFDAQTRHHLICESLSLGGKAMSRFTLVDPNGVVLLCEGLFGTSSFELVPLYGSDPTPFPFLSKKFELVNHRYAPISTDARLKLTTPSSLEELLCCKTTDFVFRKISLGNGVFSEVKVPISELKSKFVGLYLYDDGRLLPLLRDIMDASKQSSKDELEIIVVYNPFCFNHDLRLYPEYISRVLAKQNISWWVAPFNYTATLMLTRFFDFEDRVVIVGPNGQCVDPRGAELMQIYGMYAYPFTFECVVQKTVDELKQVSLDNFIKFLQIQGNPLLVNKKKVLFYFDWPWSVDTDVYGALEHFTRCKDVCVIPVSFCNEESLEDCFEGARLNGLEDDNKTLELKWHTESADKSSEFSKRFFNGQFPTIVAFGKNGKICSVRAHRLSSSYCSAGAKAKVRGNLHEEVSFFINKTVSMRDIEELLMFDDAKQELQKLRETMLDLVN